MNFTSLDNFSIDDIKKLVLRALYFKNNQKDIPKLNLSACLIFFEPSTRTNISFQKALSSTASTYCILETNTSSFLKKETLYDTILTLKQLKIANFIIRSGENHYYKSLESIKNINIVNAGDGVNSHPSQSLLDLVTIYEHFHRFKNLKIAIVGDLNHSRVCYSNYKLFKRLNFEVYLCCYEKVNYDGYEIDTYNFNDIIEEMDVVIFLRIQNERFLEAERENKLLHDPKTYNRLYGLNSLNYKRLKSNAIFLHPGPVNRNWEIETDLVYQPKSKILDQVENGLFTRIAILEYISKNKS
ncbi:aspartate carbamoyltransferase catalytic subunit [Mycoplasma sp. SG1]|uniref:aspartate carbamoyltransferase catalytic subunit n=1 Tax=Mycoplasma sp. SG1 TaxID=2810348 RepID=UPI00202557FD|nr:aspartate carbamoyltransferase catalytic subunit [Mycoplasma sp. SG1]URM52825.1 aspartate carbamoyltransferase catalytic subunit [Mycoplasma sp. SG1]